MKNNITVRWECPECEKQTEVSVTPFIPAKIYGPPEKCHPAEGGEYEPGKCDHCGHAIPDDDISELAADEYDWQRESAAEDRAERLREAKWRDE